ncbi:MAG TPA: DNA cytosine methyltransferase [Burkholderiaceae bacterium]
MNTCAHNITFGSVCSGIEAASVAWHPLGWRAAWLAEIEAFPSTVLAHHYPDVPNLGDMTKIAAQVRTSDVEAPDVLVGGTPCQAFSIAGLRNSLEDSRGQLTLSFVDLANAIDTTRAFRREPAAIIVWENVPGVLSTPDNAFGCFLGALAGEDRPLVPSGSKWPNAGCVFGPQRTVAWRVLDAQYFGVAQRRRRVFVVASARDGFDPTAVLFEFEGVRRDTAPRRDQGQNTTAGTLRCTDGGSDVDHVTAGHLQPVVGTLQSNGKAAGSATQQDAEAGMLVPLSVALRGREGGAMAELGDEVAGCLRASTGGGDKAHVLAPIAFSGKDFGADATVELSPTLRAIGHSGSHANGGGQMAVAFRIHGENSTAMRGPGAANVADPVEIARCLDTNGGYATNQGGNIILDAVCVTGDITHTLKAEGFDASEDGTGRGQPIVAAYSTKLHNTKSNGAGKIYPEYTASLDANSPPPALLTAMAVRRLTPVECERLQSFPDRYTLIPVKKAKRRSKQYDYVEIDGQLWQLSADGPRYKALGNSMCVFNMRWIGARIDMALCAQQVAA